MADGIFTRADVARCKSAMSKPGPLGALRTLASGRAVVEVVHDCVDDVLIDTFDGRIVRDQDHPDCKIGLAGSWPLYAAGMIDKFGVLTDAGRAALARQDGGQPCDRPSGAVPAGMDPGKGDGDGAGSERG